MISGFHAAAYSMVLLRPKMQAVFHHVLPLALPGILTGTIIGMARALGETAPLLMIGMKAFVATPPDAQERLALYQQLLAEVGAEGE